MAEPKVYDAKPQLVELETEKNYAWCACGQSSNQPWCDGSHKGSGITPTVFQVDESKVYAMCNCKQSNTPQFCDGTHKTVK
ncbi:MAG: CDGSH iron-sulfur domain-containing protein [Balneola sp.]